MRKMPSRLEPIDSSIFQEAARRKQMLQNPIDLSVGIPEGTTPDYIKEAGIRAIQNNHTTYIASNGLPELRAAIAHKLRSENSLPATTETVTIMPGLTTGMLMTYFALLSPGDEVLLMDPSYPSYHYLIPLTGATLKRVPTLPSFQLNLTAIENAITPHTRIIVINSPNNPTGAIYPKEDLIQLASIAERHNITIISDEMYENFIYEGEHFSIGSIYPNTITMNGFSKSYAMTGWRLGYAHGPQQLINQINRVQQYAVFSSSSIAQYAALAAVSRPPIARDSYRQKRDLIKDTLTSIGYDVGGCQGAYYAFIKTPKEMSDLDFTDIAAEQNLIIIPGRAFSESQTYVRLSYGGKIEDIEKGLKIIKKITQEISL